MTLKRLETAHAQAKQWLRNIVNCICYWNKEVQGLGEPVQNVWKKQFTIQALKAALMSLVYKNEKSFCLLGNCRSSSSVVMPPTDFFAVLTHFFLILLSLAKLHLSYDSLLKCHIFHTALLPPKRLFLSAESPHTKNNNNKQYKGYYSCGNFIFTVCNEF